MKILAKVMALPGTKNILFLILLLVIIWVFGPLFSLGGGKPFSSVNARWALSGIVVLLMILRFIIELLIKYKTKTGSKIKEFSKAAFKHIEQLFQQTSSAMKNKMSSLQSRAYEDKKGRQYRKLPWYLVMGPRSSGKTTLITQSGLGLKSQEQLDTEAIGYLKEFPTYDWWFTDQNVLIDMTDQSPVIRDETEAEASEQQKTWQRFVKLLCKKRSAKPISGVLFTFSLVDLLLKDNKTRQAELYNMCLQIRQIHSVCKVQVPIYITFTKCDLIEGFVEYFNDLSKEELVQIWGLTIPLTESMNMTQAVSAFNRAYNSLMLSLAEKTLWKIDAEKNEEKRALIYAFVQQISLFSKTIENFIAEFFGAVRYPKAIQLRGVYFTSGIQQGKPQDFLMHVLMKKYQLGGESSHREAKQSQEGYFIHSIFKQILMRDSEVLGYSNKVKTARSLSYRAAMLLLPTLTVVGITGSIISYKVNKANLATIAKNIVEYQNNYTKLDKSDPDLTKTLPTLNSVKSIYDLYAQKNHGWLVEMLPASHRTVNAINGAFHRSINTLFLPRVALELENTLKQPMVNANILYSVLEAYLAFSPTEPTPSASLMGPMTYTWSHQYSDNPQLQKRLEFYLRQATTATLEKLPLDRVLIDNTREKLRQVAPERRAYGLLLLEANTADLESINFRVKYSPNFNSVFVADDKNLNISPFYTQAGYEQIFERELFSIAHQVVEDNKKIGLGTKQNSLQNNHDLIQQLQKDYNQDYTQQWQHYLQNFNILPFDNEQTALKVLTLLTSDQSPLAEVLSAVQTNTQALKSENLTMATSFAALSQYAGGEKPSAEMVKINATLSALKDYLTKIQQAANQNQAAFEAAQYYMTGDLKDPIRALTLEAQTAPAPLNLWLSTIADQSWALVLQQAMAYMNNAWNNQVMSVYNAELKNRYPFDPKAASQASIDAFSSVFATGGLIDQFFNQYLSKFVDTSQKPWKLYQLNGHGLPMSRNELNLFQRAATIRQLYFPNGSKIPTMQFAMKPRTLDENAKSISMTLGSLSIAYSHGPQQPQPIAWPVPVAEQSVQALMQGFDGTDHTEQFYGPWALLQLIGQGNVRASNKPNQYIFDVNLGGFKSSFMILTTSDLSVFQLNALKGYALPDKL